MVVFAPFLALLLAGANIASGRYSIDKTYAGSDDYWHVQYFPDHFEAVETGFEPSGEKYPNEYTNPVTDKNARDEFFTKKNGQDTTTIGVGRYYFNDELPRDGIRVVSKNTFTNGVFVFRFADVPKKFCGLTPTLSFTPDNDADGITLMSHPAAGQNNNVWVRLKPLQQGEKETCQVHVDDMRGKGVLSKGVLSNQSFSDSADNSIMNTAYVMLRTTDSIEIYSWKSTTTPSDIKSGSIPTVIKWGRPIVSIGGEGCNINERLSPHRISFQIGFCGGVTQNDWDQECKAVTGRDTCPEHLQWTASESDYQKATWKIKEVMYYALKEKPAKAKPDGNTGADSTEKTEADSTENTETDLTENTETDLTENTEVDSTENTEADSTDSTETGLTGRKGSTGNIGADLTENTEVDLTENTEVDSTENTEADSTDSTETGLTGRKGSTGNIGADLPDC